MSGSIIIDNDFSPIAINKKFINDSFYDVLLSMINKKYPAMDINEKRNYKDRLKCDIISSCKKTKDKGLIHDTNFNYKSNRLLRHISLITKVNFIIYLIDDIIVIHNKDNKVNLPIALINNNYYPMFLKDKQFCKNYFTDICAYYNLSNE